MIPLLAVAVLLLVSSQTGFNRYLRYMLPAFPFLFIWMSQVARHLEWKRPGLAALVLFAVVASVGESLWIYPHSMSFFNVAVGGPRGGPKHLLDANIDWGQDLLYLKRWAEAHPEARPLYVEYFGFIDAGLAGFPDPAPEGELKPGWYAVSVNYAEGYRHFGTPHRHYEYFRNLNPFDSVGYSIWVYDVTKRQ